MRHSGGLLIAVWSWTDPLAILLAVGLAAVFIAFAILVWTSWGQARPVSKCMVLSLLAHALLLIYAYGTRVLFATPGKWTGQSVTVRIYDAEDDVFASPFVLPEQEDWNQAGSVDAALSAAPPLERGEPHLEPADVAIRRSSPPSDAKPAAPPAETPLDNAPSLESAETPSAPSEIARTEASDTDVLTAEPVEAAAELPRQPAERVATPPMSAAAEAPPAPEAAQGPAVAHTASQPAPMEEHFASAPAPTPRRLGDGQAVPEPLTARLAANRLMVAQPFGATARSEAAVAAALDWLAKAQSEDGRWIAAAHGAGRETPLARAASGGQDRRGTGGRADTGITGLALLAFLGSGETHLDGEHRECVQHGLEWLLSVQAADGNLAGNADFFASMYSHGIATLALGEAYALSGDERLLPGLKRAIQYTINSQHAGGGWRYQPYDAGDMSQFGWQVMALRSAELGGIPIPAQTRSRMIRFLQGCSAGRQRGLASYRPGDRPSRSMTAEALVCRHFLNSENSAAALDEGTAYVMEERPGVAMTDFYYWYYGTLATYQRQGDDWKRWNSSLQHELLSRQRWDADYAGSYDPDDLWGGYGGRVYSTALATLCLEVYYRYLPVIENRPESRLTDRPWQPAVPR